MYADQVAIFEVGRGRVVCCLLLKWLVPLQEAGVQHYVLWGDCRVASSMASVLLFMFAQDPSSHVLWALLWRMPKVALMWSFWP